MVVNVSLGPEFVSFFSVVAAGVTVISSINFASGVGAATDTTCLLLVKLSGLNVLQLLRKITPITIRK